MLPGPERDAKIRGHFDNLIRHRNQKDFQSISNDFLKTLYSLLGRRKNDFLALVGSNFYINIKNGMVTDQQFISLVLCDGFRIFNLFINFLNQNQSDGKQTASNH